MLIFAWYGQQSLRVPEWVGRTLDELSFYYTLNCHQVLELTTSPTLPIVHYRLRSEEEQLPA